MIPLGWRLRLPRSRFEIFIALSQQAQKGVMVSAGMADLDYQGGN